MLRIAYRNNLKIWERAKISTICKSVKDVNFIVNWDFLEWKNWMFRFFGCCCNPMILFPAIYQSNYIFSIGCIVASDYYYYYYWFLAGPSYLPRICSSLYYVRQAGASISVRWWRAFLHFAIARSRFLNSHYLVSVCLSFFLILPWQVKNIPSWYSWDMKLLDEACRKT